jgi:hypothetical protein
MTDDDEQCGAIWHDQLNPDTPTYRCDKNAGHDRPHTSHGVTWGNPTEWGIEVNS